ncbi:MAG: rhomboid family intramembrane serine protease [Candidatus Acidiferrum sp.]
MIPLTDASRRPAHFPIVTICIIATNFLVFVLELNGGEAFVLKWAAIPANITAGHNWITILTAMFMHGSWSHILGNMVFLWAFGPEMEDAMNPLRYLAFYLGGGLVAMLTQIVLSPNSTVPNLGASGAIAAVMGGFLMTYPSDQIRVILIILVFVRIKLIPAALLIGVWFLIQLFNVGSVATFQTGGVAYAAHVGGAIFGMIFARRFEDPQRVCIGHLSPITTKSWTTRLQ